MRTIPLVLLMAASVGVLATPAEQTLAIEQVQASPAQERTKKPRLKFKNRGPVCLCADGLSEQDIQEQQIIFKRKKRESK